jgi:hypothetical protein
MATDELQTIVARYRARMTALQTVVAAQGALRAKHKSDEGYAILLCRDMSRGTGWRVTSFRDGQPLGHREYDVLDGGGPTRDALAEFASDVWVILPAR